MSDKEVWAGYTMGALVSLIGVAASMSREDTIPSFRVSKDLKKRVKALGKKRGWSMAQTAYYCVSIGLAAFEDADKVKE